MRKEFEKDKHTGYTIGKDIEIHRNINDPESWFITVRPLRIFGLRLCKLTNTEPEIARCAHLVITKDLNICEKLINEIIPFT